LEKDIFFKPLQNSRLKKTDPQSTEVERSVATEAEYSWVCWSEPEKYSCNISSHPVILPRKK
jgi:hypothetical protein